MAPLINVRAEVEGILKREMTPEESVRFSELREAGYANPYDIVQQLKVKR